MIFHQNPYRSIQKRQDRLRAFRKSNELVKDNSSGERKQVSSTPKPWKVVRPKKEQLDDFGAVKHNITGSGSQPQHNTEVR